MAVIYEQSFQVREVIGGSLGETLATAVNINVALAAYEAALKTRNLQYCKIALCNGARIVRKSWED